MRYHARMRDRLKELLALVEANRRLDPFYAELTAAEMFGWAVGEIEEAKDELVVGNDAALEGEMGDVVWNLFMLLDKLEDEGRLKKEAVYERIIQKISARKSFLAEGRPVTKEEAREIWNEAKRGEGYSEDRLWTE